MIESGQLLAQWANLEQAGVPWGGLIVSEFGEVEKTLVLSGTFQRGLMIQTASKPFAFPEFDAVDVQVNQLETGKWTLLFVLLDPEHQDEFATLCSDMLAVCIGINEEAETLTRMLEAYRSWLDFYKTSASLTVEVLRGLFGELLFLKEILLTKMTASAAISAWQGPLGSPQDFILDGFRAAEIKTVRPGGVRVKISSLSQLDYMGELYLVVYPLDLVSGKHAGQTTQQLISSITQGLNDVDSKAFAERLAALRLDLQHKFVSEIKFQNEEARFYRADTIGFPKLTTESIPLGIDQAKYEIGLAALEPYKSGGIGL